MQHVLKRRYTRLLENNEKMPDLIIVDGGINQLRSGEAALKEINVNNWYLVLVSSIIMIACGLYIIIKSNLVLSGIGIVLVIYAIIDIVQFIMIPKSKNPDIIIK